jgi:hypothetical protein
LVTEYYAVEKKLSRALCIIPPGPRYPMLLT